MIRDWSLITWSGGGGGQVKFYPYKKEKICNFEGILIPGSRITVLYELI